MSSNLKDEHTGSSALVDPKKKSDDDSTNEDVDNDNNPKETEKPKQASLSQCLSFAKTNTTRWLLVVAFLNAFVSGLVFPSMAYIFAAVFEDLSADVEDADEFLEKVRNLAFTFMGLGAILLICMTTQATCAEIAALQMTRALQNDWFAALLRQDMVYHDMRDSTGEATLITIHGNKFKKGFGKKLAAGFQYFVTFVGGMAYSFYASWQNALMVLAVTPVMVVSSVFLVQMNTSQSARANASYAAAGSIVTTAVRSLRTLLALNALPRMIASYEAATLQAQVGACQQVALLGLANGSQMGSLVLSFLVITLFGTWLLYDQTRDNGCDPSGTVDDNDRCDPASLDILGSLFGVFIAASVLPQVSVALEALTAARVAAYPALVAIERTSHPQPPSSSEPPEAQKGASTDSAESGAEANNNGHATVKADDDEKNKNLDSDEEEAVQLRRGEHVPLPPFVIDAADQVSGLKPDSVQGHVHFDAVTFAYPTRQEQPVFRNFSLHLAPGTTVALVGPSGSGKSTAIALLERFYDPQGGRITLDGNDLRDLNVPWLRQHVGLVSQEPKLFAVSIAENIRLGAAPGTTVSQAEIEAAARRANAHDFITSFPDGYDTQVGDLGGQLSGGQRQRIAIARVLIKKPQILLLDEATSALDSESEATVQAALDDLMNDHDSGMTTFVIAHRLATIRKADQIAVLGPGVGHVVELGTHEELVQREGGLYKSLVEKQQVGGNTTTNEEEAPMNDASLHDTTHSEEQQVKVAPSAEDLIEFRDVHFTYPARPDIPVFRGLNLTVRQGETLALCGPSGQGKSTVIQLLERFYDPDEGTVSYQGHNIRDLNVKWWRNELGLVSQEPTLFDCSVRDNISYGAESDVTLEEIQDAAKLANAHDFIQSFPDGYNTQVGSSSSLLISGGQKQRICIARALLKRPKVLLLDEATSALDSESERLVQAALDNLMADSTRTTIVIAHRLSTIRNANRIAVVDKGKIREIGTHQELMAKPDGRYARLVSLQNLDSNSEAKGPVDEKASVLLSSVVESTAKKDNEVDKEGKEEVDEDEKATDKEIQKAHAARARSLASQELSYFLYGSVGAIFAGLIFPAWGVAFGYMIEVIYTSAENCEDSDPVFDFDTCQAYYDDVADDMQTKARKISYAYAGICVSTLVGFTLLYWAFGNASERINKRVRDAAFVAIVRQEVGWFDLRQPSAIASQLAEDAALLHSFSGEPIRTLVLNVASVAVGIITSFIYMWPFALLTLATIPFMAFGAEMEMAMYYGEDEGDDEQLRENSAGSVAIEAVSNIRTIAALTLEEKKAAEYVEALHAEEPHPLKSSFSKGVGAGAGQFIQMWGYGLMFWWGGWLLSNYDTWSFLDYVVSMFALMFALYGLAVAAEGAVNRDKALAAAHRIFELQDRKSKIDPLSDEGETY